MAANFKSDDSFLRKLAVGAAGTNSTIEHLTALGFSPIELERGSTGFKIWKKITLAMQQVRDTALKSIGELEPAGVPKSEAEAKGIFLSSRTNGGRDLPAYYLVYFLLVDLLGFPNLGRWEKVAWRVPVRYRGRLYAIEHRQI